MKFSIVDILAGISFGFTIALWVSTWASLKQTIYIPFGGSPSAYETTTQVVDVTLFSEVFVDGLTESGKTHRTVSLVLLALLTLCELCYFFIEPILGSIYGSDDLGEKYEDEKEKDQRLLFETIILSVKSFFIIILLFYFNHSLKEGYWFPNPADTYAGSVHAAQILSILIVLMDVYILYKVLSKYKN